MQSIANIPIRDLCCSCGSCAGVCSRGAIRTVFKQGLFVPEVDSAKCVDCGLCSRVCPSTPREVESIYGNPELFSDNEIESYIAFSNDEVLRRTGTSGGFVSTMIRELLRKGIYEKAYILDYENFEGNQAKIRPVDYPENVIKSAKSKYIPASIEEVVKDVVCGTIGKSIIVATPCQMLAIKECFKLKKRSEEDVLFIGLFCDKTLNYNIYGYYREKYGEYDSLHFRDKEGNNWPGDTVLYKNGKKTVIDKQVRMSLKPFFQLNRCRFCFDKLNQLADISCGDCYIKGEESKEGKSSIIIRSMKGSEALKECSSVLSLKKSCLSDIKNSQCLRNKLENYKRNSSPDSPFIVPVLKENFSSHNKGLEQLRLGENANNPKGYKRIDKYIAMESKPTGGIVKRILNRLLKFVYNPDHSVKVLIDNAGFINKGAELMLQSVVQQLEMITPKVRIVVPERVFYENLDYCYRHHILPLKLVYGRTKVWIKNLLYRNLLNKPWFISPDQIDIVLDAGGFQFSDQWPISKGDLYERKKYYSSFSKSNRKIVFLPQAFGPFEQPMSRQLMETVYTVADLIYAREPESYNYLISLFPENNKIKIAPDFTCLSKYKGRVSVDLPDGYVVLVPNVRMVTHTAENVSDNYLDFLHEVSEFLIGKGETVVFLNHEGKDDLELLLKLNEGLSQKVLLLSSLDALAVKRVIGRARLLISSRFHGVVSGLTQGVPTLCTSWSHKYFELMKEHGCESGILSINDLGQAKQSIENALKNPQTYASKDGCISEVTQKATDMWEEIWKMTGLKKKSL